MIEEAIIIKKILAGNHAQYKLLLERYQTGLLRHCMTMVNDYETASDLMQQTSIKGFFHLKQYQNKYRFSTWLYKIATNLCRDFLRKRHHISLDYIPEPISNTLSPSDQAIQNESINEVHTAIKKLPLKYQTVISLYYWQERSYEEISMIMNTPINTVRTWLKRAKEMLKEELRG